MGVWALRSAFVAWAGLDCVATTRRIASKRLTSLALVGKLVN